MLSLFTLGALAGSLVLVFLNGVFVAAEFAIVKVRRTRLQELAGQGVKAAKTSIIAVDQLNEMLSAIQLGITLVSLGLGWLGEEAFANLFLAVFPRIKAIGPHAHHAIAVGVSFFIITMLHVVLGELVPKQLAIQDAEKITLRVARPLVAFYRATLPLIRTFTGLADFVVRRLGHGNQEESPLSENELKMVMKESTEEGVITESEAQIITRAFEFSDKRATDIMVHANRVEYLSLDRTIEQNVETINKHMFTRFPLCRSDLHSVIGVVHMKDVWPALFKTYSNDALRASARPALFVTPGTSQDRLLRTFQSQRGHLALVRDSQHQRTLGLVSLEDVLEGLVGEIRDEHGN